MPNIFGSAALDEVHGHRFADGTGRRTMGQVGVDMVVRRAVLDCFICTIERPYGGTVRDEQLYAFVADARAQTGATMRRRTRWLRQQLREDVSVSQVYHDLARVHAAAELTLVGGRTCRGRVAAANPGVVALARPHAVTYVSTDAIAGLRPLAHVAGEAAQRGQAGDGGTAIVTPPLRAARALGDLIADLAADHTPVRVGTADTIYMATVGGVARDFVWFDDDARCLRIDAITDVEVETRR